MLCIPLTIGNHDGQGIVTFPTTGQYKLVCDCLGF